MLWWVVSSTTSVIKRVGLCEPNADCPLRLEFGAVYAVEGSSVTSAIAELVVSPLNGVITAQYELYEASCDVFGGEPLFTTRLISSSLQLLSSGSRFSSGVVVLFIRVLDLLIALPLNSCLGTTISEFAFIIVNALPVFDETVGRCAVIFYY